MRVAALNDVHGNLPALDAVLRELAFERVDRIVFGGDLAAGPFPRETVEIAGNLPHAEFVRGNADRYMVEVAEGRAEPQGLVDDWAVAQLGPEHLDFLRSFEPAISLDGVLYCHATPHADEPIFTERSPDERVRALLGHVEERTVVVGHTHMQFDRVVDGIRVVNAGSVGLPYGTTNACWALVVDGEPQLRETPYPREAVTASAYEKLEPFLTETSRDEATEFFERQAAAG
jgi:putative phosphoesterase